MNQPGHIAIFTTDKTNKHPFTQQLLDGKAIGDLAVFNPLNGLLFSKVTMDALIDEELRHDHIEVSKGNNRILQSLSDGEQKKALLQYLLAQHPDYIILDNPFDNLDKASQAALLVMLERVATGTLIIQFINRSRDLLPFIRIGFDLDDHNKWVAISDLSAFIQERNEKGIHVFNGQLPPPMHRYAMPPGPLVAFDRVTIKYDGRGIVKDICWTILPGESWQLVGPNGSGKTTLLSLITGDNPKAYGQDITIFGRRKGSGEAVWEIKKNIGYFTPSITSMFNRYDSVEKMIIGGFFDSVGLYIRPSDTQQKIARQWLNLVGMLHLKDTLFHKLSLGQQRTALIARAMIKHPPLLILDEPTSGLDDQNAGLVVSMINKIAQESNTTILYVSHRTEADLSPNLVFELTPAENGSTGKVAGISA
ncbi:MAG: ATP-binding cassette domain-containing protein [Chitinophagaceae bacterium]